MKRNSAQGRSPEHYWCRESCRLWVSQCIVGIDATASLWRVFVADIERPTVINLRDTVSEGEAQGACGQTGMCRQWEGASWRHPGDNVKNMNYSWICDLRYASLLSDFNTDDVQDDTFLKILSQPGRVLSLGCLLACALQQVTNVRRTS